MDTPTISVTSCGHSLNSSVTSSSAISCEDFEEKVINEDKNNNCYNFHHALRDLESVVNHVCQDGYSCGSKLKG